MNNKICSLTIWISWCNVIAMHCKDIRPQMNICDEWFTT